MTKLLKQQLQFCLNKVERYNSDLHAGVIYGLLLSVAAMPKLTPKMVTEKRPNPMWVALPGWPDMTVEREETTNEMLVRFANEYIARQETLYEPLVCHNRHAQ
jgi:hypothetical protein